MCKDGSKQKKKMVGFLTGKSHWSPFRIWVTLLQRCKYALHMCYFQNRSSLLTINIGLLWLCSNRIHSFLCIMVVGRLSPGLHVFGGKRRFPLPSHDSDRCPSSQVLGQCRYIKLMFLFRSINDRKGCLEWDDNFEFPLPQRAKGRLCARSSTQSRSRREGQRGRFSCAAGERFI